MTGKISSVHYRRSDWPKCANPQLQFNDSTNRSNKQKISSPFLIYNR